MFRKVLILAAVAAILSFCCEAEAAQINVSWDGGGDGHLWSDADNWDPNGVPDNGANTYNVTIDSNPIGYPLDISLTQDRTINQLSCDGDVDLEGEYTLTLEDVNGLIYYGTGEVGDIEIIGNVTGNSSDPEGFTLDDIEIIGANLYNLAGSKLEIDADVGVDIDAGTGGLVDNNGTITLTPASELWAWAHFNNHGLVKIYNGECGSDQIFDNNSTGFIRGFGIVYADQLFLNKGTVCASGGSLSILSDGPLENTGILINNPVASLSIKPAADMNNFGTMQVHSGGGISIDCNVTNISGATIELLGGTFAAQGLIQKEGATLTGFGTIAVYNGLQIEPGASIQLTGPTNIVGDVNIPTGATLEISDGQTLITGHTTCDGTIHLIGGTVVFQGGCDCEDCNIINEAGIDRNHFDLNADGIEDFKDFAYFAETWLWQASWY